MAGAVPAGGNGGTGEERTAELIHEAWVNFVRTGRPLPDWPAYGEDRPVYVFDEDSHVETDPRRAERLAWGDVTWQPDTWFPLAGRG
ncbi:hypothetical protein GCM10029964_005240 [Kibdelosporangium lantanae]